LVFSGYKAREDERAQGERNQRGKKHSRKKDRTEGGKGEKRAELRKRKKETEPGRETVQRGAKFVPLFLLKETEAFGAIL
jgi:hypothetical protein